MPITKEDLGFPIINKGQYRTGTVFVVGVPANNETATFNGFGPDVVFEFSTTDPVNSNIWIDTTTYNTTFAIAEKLRNELNSIDPAVNPTFYYPGTGASFSFSTKNFDQGFNLSDGTGGDITIQINTNTLPPREIVLFHRKHVVTAFDVNVGEITMILPFADFLKSNIGLDVKETFRIQTAVDDNTEVAYDLEPTETQVPGNAQTLFRVLTFTNTGAAVPFVAGNLISVWGMGILENQQ